MEWVFIGQKRQLIKKAIADILDLRTLLPLDKEAIYETVKRTNRVPFCMKIL